VANDTDKSQLYKPVQHQSAPEVEKQAANPSPEVAK